MKRPWLIIFAVVFILFIGSDLLLFMGKADSWWQQVPGFFALFGLVFCLVIVIVSKLLGHFWLQRKEDYYDRNDSDD